MKESNLLSGAYQDAAAKQMYGSRNALAEPEDLTIGDAFDREIDLLEGRIERLQMERDSMSPELLTMKRSQILRMLREVPG